MFDQLVAELQAVVVDVVHERGDRIPRRPAGVAEACHHRIIVRIAMDTSVLEEEARLRNGVVSDEDHECAAPEQDSGIPRAPRPAVLLGAED